MNQSRLDIYKAIWNELKWIYHEICDDLWGSVKKREIKTRSFHWPHSVTFNRRVFQMHEKRDDRGICQYLYGNEWDWKINCPFSCPDQFEKKDMRGSLVELASIEKSDLGMRISV